MTSQRDYAEKNSKRVVQHTTSVTVAETTLMIISISISSLRLTQTTDTDSAARASFLIW
jgi:hypothetical protein